jgi:ABC-type nitrate/sulfonate/bicarbonate transport system substrate-binding protein
MIGSRLFALTLTALFVSAASAPLRASAQAAPRTVNLGLTSITATEWPLEVADKMGFLAANGVKANLVVVGSAAGNAQQLTAGSLDLAVTSSSQLIEAVEGGAPLAGVLDLTTTSPYLILGQKGLTSIAALRGKTMIVGGVNDITRIFTDGVLEADGVRPSDVTYTYAGATAQRYAALVNGSVAGAILVPPFAFRAQAQGYPVLDEVQRHFPAFPVDLVATNVTWAKAHPEVLLAFLKGYLQGVRWLDDPRNRARAIAILADYSNTSAEDAAKTYDLYMRIHVFAPSGAIVPADFRKVIDALGKIGILKAPLPAPSRFIDDRYVEQAAAALRRR